MKKLLLIIFALVLSNKTTYGQEVTIGTQIWQTTNLNVTTYRDGTVIPQVTDPAAWTNLTTGAWCYINNDQTNGTVYGKLYNWYAVGGIYDEASLYDPTLRKQFAPTGWHVPRDAEWTTLTTFLVGDSVARSTMKETGVAHWQSPNISSNSSGFTGLPGGYRDSGGNFTEIGYYCMWWSSSKYNSLYNWARHLSHWYSYVNRDNNYNAMGFSVRCLKGESLLSNTTFDKSNIELYPNPVLNVLNVKVNSNLINQTYTIIDCLGRVVLKGRLNDIDTTVNVEQLSKGLYYLKVSDNIASKFVKE